MFSPSNIDWINKLKKIIMEHDSNDNNHLSKATCVCQILANTEKILIVKVLASELQV